MRQISTQERAVAGCIVQFVRSDGVRRTVVVTGPAGFHYHYNVRSNTASGMGVRKSPVAGASSALRAAIERMESWPREWKVEVISAPTTILTDLQGSRRHVTRPRTAVSTGTLDVRGSVLHLPEERMLGAIGRADLLAARVG